jgi:hypothetical protein
MGVGIGFNRHSAPGLIGVGIGFDRASQFLDQWISGLARWPRYREALNRLVRQMPAHVWKVEDLDQGPMKLFGTCTETEMLTTVCICLVCSAMCLKYIVRLCKLVDLDLGLSRVFASRSITRYIQARLQFKGLHILMYTVSGGQSQG